MFVRIVSLTLCAGSHLSVTFDPRVNESQPRCSDTDIYSDVYYKPPCGVFMGPIGLQRRTSVTLHPDPFSQRLIVGGRQELLALHGSSITSIIVMLERTTNTRCWDLNQDSTGTILLKATSYKCDLYLEIHRIYIYAGAVCIYIDIYRYLHDC